MSDYANLKEELILKVNEWIRLFDTFEQDLILEQDLYLEQGLSSVVGSTKGIRGGLAIAISDGVNIVTGRDPFTVTVDGVDYKISPNRNCCGECGHLQELGCRARCSIYSSALGGGWIDDLQWSESHQDYFRKDHCLRAEEKTLGIKDIRQKREEA
jgi:hypothetical protein